MDKRWHSGIGQLATIFNVAYIKERKDDIHKYYLIINTPTRDLFQPYRMDPGKRATNARPSYHPCVTVLHVCIDSALFCGTSAFTV